MLKFCGSLPVAIVVMVVLIGVLIPATCLENWYGPAAARFGVYGTWWFAALAVLLAVNVFAALVVRFPWKQRRTGFLLSHLGLLVLLLGCLLTRRYGIDAQLPVFEGQAASTATEDSYHFQLTPGKPAGGDICVPFDPGPFNWADYAQLPRFPWGLVSHDRGLLYDRDGIRLEALDYYSDSRQITLPWLQLLTTPGPASPHGRPAADGEPAPVVLTVRASRHPHAAGRPFGLGGRAELAGGQQLIFWMTDNAAETAAFRDARPDGPLGRKGRIVLYAGGRTYQFAVDELPPKSAPSAGQDRLGSRVGQVRSRLPRRATAHSPRQAAAADDASAGGCPRAVRARLSRRRVRHVLVRRHAAAGCHCWLVQQCHDRAPPGARLVQPCGEHGWTSQPWHPRSGRRRAAGRTAPRGRRSAHRPAPRGRRQALLSRLE